jgi:hypothetical protein
MLGLTVSSGQASMLAEDVLGAARGNADRLAKPGAWRHDKTHLAYEIMLPGGAIIPMARTSLHSTIR